MKTCTVDGCDRKYESKGMCHMHYQRTRKRTPDKPVTRECIVCGTSVIRSPKAAYVFGATCSQKCKTIVQFGWRTELPADHRARMYGATCEWKAPKDKGPMFQCGTCADCNAPFTEPAGQTASTYCSLRCSDRVARRRRRAREHGADGSYRFTEIIHLYLLAGSVCAYCETPVVGLPDPEHVTPLSRGGRNDRTNLVAACRACNSDKNDLTLTEWATDRQRRGLSPVRTALDLTSKAFRHLVLSEPTAPAWRHREAA